MTHESKGKGFAEYLRELSALQYNPLDLLSRRNLEEKLIELLLEGVPAGPLHAVQGLNALAGILHQTPTEDVRVVVFGGGTGLSNVIGGDSRRREWPDDPFSGLKAIFPNTRSIVCITDDGGSTGEMLKDLPLIAVGDLRRVLLSSIHEKRLEKKYGAGKYDRLQIVATLHRLFNYRYEEKPRSVADLEKKGGFALHGLPNDMEDHLRQLLDFIFTDSRFQGLRGTPHCLGNLLLAAAMYYFGEAGDGLEIPSASLMKGLRRLAELLGAHSEAVLPCTTTPAQIKILYENGVLVTGEAKSGEASRGYPVDRVFVEFADTPHILPEVLESIEGADIIVFAPGSLYTSIIPIMQTPALAAAVRENTKALKVLVANLWVQRGETDVVRDDPRRRFYVSDLLHAYHRNIPGGVDGLFNNVLVLGLQNIKASILQNYAVEDKVPIYLDRGRVWDMGFTPVEARIFSKKALADHRIVQHGPHSLSLAIKTIWIAREYIEKRETHLAEHITSPSSPSFSGGVAAIRETSCQRMERFRRRLDELSMDGDVRDAILEIVWRHRDIPVEHFQYIDGVRFILPELWERSQRWDRIFSFYDPRDRLVKIHSSVTAGSTRFEASFLIALGESLLGDYAACKETVPVEVDGEEAGKIYRLTLGDDKDRNCYLIETELDRYLVLARMKRSGRNRSVYTRLVNGNEGFTPPGLLFGLIYSWYLDNRHAAHIEYKMAIIRGEVTDLIPEQVKMLGRRQELVAFFRSVVFKQWTPLEG